MNTYTYHVVLWFVYRVKFEGYDAYSAKDASVARLLAEDPDELRLRVVAFGFAHVMHLKLQVVFFFISFQQVYACMMWHHTFWVWIWIVVLMNAYCFQCADGKTITFEDLYIDLTQSCKFFFFGMHCIKHFLRIIKLFIFISSSWVGIGCPVKVWGNATLKVGSSECLTVMLTVRSQWAHCYHLWSEQ